jgi:hypothetical protein
MILDQPLEDHSRTLILINIPIFCASKHSREVLQWAPSIRQRARRAWEGASGRLSRLVPSQRILAHLHVAGLVVGRQLRNWITLGTRCERCQYSPTRLMTLHSTCSASHRRLNSTVSSQLSRGGGLRRPAFAVKDWQTGLRFVERCEVESCETH